jgi:shikimate dehydrogenase
LDPTPQDTVSVPSGPLAVLGDPIGHSLSPEIHNAALKALGLPPRYVACRVPADRLEAAIRGIVDLGFLGANVTIPHKERVLPLMDVLTERARAVGAVNTVRIDRSGAAPVLHGDNTDVPGFLAPLRPLFERVHGQDVVVWGAGGAARAVVYGLLTEMAPARLTLVTRSTDRAQALLDDLGRFAGATVCGINSWQSAEDAVAAATLLVNTTPLGLAPNVEESPCPDANLFEARHIVYDLVYRPAVTRLLRDAAERGAETIGGLPMLVGQAAVSFASWFNVPMPVDAAYHALSERDDATNAVP